MSNESKIQQLLSHFGGNLDREVLESVLEIANGDMKEAIQFLQIQNNDSKQQELYDTYVKNAQSAGGSSSTVLPSDYLTKPPNWMNPSEQSRTSPLSGESESRTRINKFKKLFLGDMTLADHFGALSNNETYPYYTSVLLLMLHQGMELTYNVKSKVLAGYWALRRHDIAELLLTKYDKQFGLIEVLKALKILDTPRRIRSLEKKLDKLKKNAKNKTLSRIRGQINDLKQDLVPQDIMKTSVSGALVKHVKKWVATISKEQLGFFALHLPTEPWKELADICHFNPKDFQLNWFLAFEFGATVPDDSVVKACDNLEPSKILQVCQKYHVPYSYLRKRVPKLAPEVKIEIANYESIDTVIWFYEELSDQCSIEIDKIVSQRLEKGDVPNFGYGKLMERCLYFKQINASFYNKIIPIAESRLKQIQIPLEPVVVVCGDSSYSMDVAIRTSTIISSVVVALVDAELKFFNNQSHESPYLPKSASTVLDLATTTKADGLTSPACVLMPYYKQKRPIRSFIMVTDEIENEKFEGYYFAQLFYRYYMEVYPSNLVMISFLENPNSQEKGRMVKALESFGIVPLQFVLDATRPDLTKLDKILSTLSTEADFFSEQVDQIFHVYKQSQNLEQVLNELKSLKKPPKQTHQTNDQSNLQTSSSGVSTQTEVNKQQKEKSSQKDQSPSSASKLDDDVPHDLICPITQDIMQDPVIASDGHTYEKNAISEWIAKHETSPVTGAKLEVTLLFPNYSLRSRIKEYLEKK